MQVQFPLILDGATGTELQKRGFTGAVSAEEWVLAHPESILDIQRRYVDAGSRVLYAPSFWRSTGSSTKRQTITEGWRRCRSRRRRAEPWWPETCPLRGCFSRLWERPPSGSWWTFTRPRRQGWRRPGWTCSLLRP